MHNITRERVSGSKRDAHDKVLVDGETIGEIWREPAQCPAPKDDPSPTIVRARWFCRMAGGTLIEPGEREKAKFGPGFISRDAAIEKLRDGSKHH